ncbi:MAG: dynamin family protein [Syntrophaceae bacterium]|nr:dynamin family protein [Syntrophaceae bacterium]
MGVLSKEQESLLREERGLMNDLRTALGKFEAEPEDEGILRESIQQLDELFLLVVVGEFNSGKTAVINALLGQPLLEEGVTPTTTRIPLIRRGEPGTTVLGEDQILVTFPVEFLSAMTIVDTPGTNAVMRRHEAITSHFVPRSDLVLFVTSADRPFTESERVFLERIRDWGKKVILVINKIDILEKEEEITKVKDFVLENARLLLGVAPEAFPLSARGALRGKQGEAGLWEKSRFASFEEFLHNTLDEGSRLQLKLLNPLGVGARLSEKYLGKVDSRKASLKTDLDLLADVESQLKFYQEDMQRNFGFRMADIENLLMGMEKRGQVFFDETFRLGRVFDLLSKPRIQREFERQVVADLPRQVEEKVTQLIDWLVESDLRQWQAIHQHLSGRPREKSGRIIGTMGPGSFSYDRDRLVEAVAREARRVVDGYDRDQEAKIVADHARTAVAASAALEAGALGLGALVTTLATTAAADVTGVLLAGLVAAVGLFVIPARRRQGKAKLNEKMAALRAQLSDSLRTQFEKEIRHSLERIQEAISPYTRFVRAEREKMEEMEKGLKDLKVGIERLRTKIETIR